MGYFSEKKKQSIVIGLLGAKNDEAMLEKLKTLQNEISVAYDTKVLAVTSLGEDDVACAFASALAEAYEHNGKRCLLIDANLYNPCLLKVLGMENEDGFRGHDNENLKIYPRGDKGGILFMKQETYPSIIYKNKTVQKCIEENKDTFDHFVVLMPNIKDHKEIALLGDIISSALLVTRRSVTKKGDIFYALQFLAANEIPVSKTIVLK